MTTRLEVESAIRQLPEGEVRHLAKWLQDYLDEKWDQQIESDFAAGKLDRLIAQAEEEIAANNESSPAFTLKSFKNQSLAINQF